jgi:hypothetical protein
MKLIKSVSVETDLYYSCELRKSLATELLTGTVQRLMINQIKLDLSYFKNVASDSKVRGWRNLG